MKKSTKSLRQGDVLLVRRDNLPAAELTEVPLEGGRIVLMHGEVTGHAHAIADHVSAAWAEAGKLADAAMSLSSRRARLLQDAAGNRYLEVTESVTLTHEEHTAHQISPGIYEIPVQVEWNVAHGFRRVAD